MADISKIKLPNEAEPRLVKDTEARNIANSKAADAVFIPADPTAATPVEAKRGLVPAPPSTPGTAKFLREDCTWAEPTGTGGTSDYDDLNDKPQINSVTLEGNKTAAQLGLQKSIKVDVSGTVTAIADANNDTEFVSGANVTITGDTSDGTITIAATDTTYNTFDATHAGLAPAGGTTAGFLKNDGAWATPDNTTYTVETGTANGKIKVTPSGSTAYEVPVYGLNNAAYKDVDSTPTENSTKLVESGGVHTALAGKLGTSDNAASAAKLNNGSSDYSVGSTSKGVYFSNGVPTEMTCTVETSVPQNAVFTDTTYTGTGAISINSSNVISVADGAVGTKGVVELSTSIPAASSAVDTKVATEKAVASVIEALPEPMVFRGTLGTGGTITSLPVDGTASKGDTYKVITAGTYAGETAKIGDTFICNTKTAVANTWVLIPSGDEPSGTVTNVATEKGITTASGSAITDTGTLKLKLKSETALTGAVLSPDTTTAKIYPATIDKDGYVSVPVPWTDTNTTYSFTYTGTKLTISANS